MADFDEALSMTPGEAPDSYLGVFGDGWTIGEAINGGVVMATAVRALSRAVETRSRDSRHTDPVVMSAYFMTASLPGPVTFRTEVLRVGRMLSTGEVSAYQDRTGAPILRMRALASFGDLTDVDMLTQAEPPDMPRPGECLSATVVPGEFLSFSSFLSRFDLRIDPGTAGWALGEPSKRGMIRGWLRLADGREPDTTMLIMALDSLPPVAFDYGHYAWTPTLEFTGHVRSRPAPGWLQVVLTSENLTSEMMEENALIWDSSGRLVAQSRQLCAVRMPRN